MLLSTAVSVGDFFELCVFKTTWNLIIFNHTSRWGLLSSSQISSCSLGLEFTWRFLSRDVLYSSQRRSDAWAGALGEAGGADQSGSALMKTLTYRWKRLSEEGKGQLKERRSSRKRCWRPELSKHAGLWARLQVYLLCQFWSFTLLKGRAVASIYRFLFYHWIVICAVREIKL